MPRSGHAAPHTEGCTQSERGPRGVMSRRRRFRRSASPPRRLAPQFHFVAPCLPWQSLVALLGVWHEACSAHSRHEAMGVRTMEFTRIRPTMESPASHEVRHQCLFPVPHERRAKIPAQAVLRTTRPSCRLTIPTPTASTACRTSIRHRSSRRSKRPRTSRAPWDPRRERALTTQFSGPKRDIVRRSVPG
jgi:hypothetical protein